jgi:hypothetical protein
MDEIYEERHFKDGEWGEWQPVFSLTTTEQELVSQVGIDSITINYSNGTLIEMRMRAE